MKCTQINPRAATHLLIDAEGGRLAVVINRISGVIRTFGQGAIRDIDGIFA